jgi:hypothetical protein
VVRRREDCSPHDVQRDSQGTQLIAMLEAADLIVACHLGQRGEQLARILWNSALPICIQASVDRDVHVLLEF